MIICRSTITHPQVKIKQQVNQYDSYNLKKRQPTQRHWKLRIESKIHPQILYRESQREVTSFSPAGEGAAQSMLNNSCSFTQSYTIEGYSLRQGWEINKKNEVVKGTAKGASKREWTNASNKCMTIMTVAKLRAAPPKTSTVLMISLKSKADIPYLL